jgi:hypothetical protein
MAADPGVQFSLLLLLLVGAAIVGLAFVLIRSGLRFTAMTIGAIVVAVATAVATAKLGYMFVAPNVWLNLNLVPSALSLVAFGVLMGLYIKRFRPDKVAVKVAIGLGLISVLAVGTPFLIVVGCQYGECINL